MSEYPTINFTGNKRKIVEWIYSSFPIKSGKVLDIFSGGGSVSYMLKSHGFEVISNDCLFANYVISKAIIENKEITLDKSVFDMEISQKEIECSMNNVSFLSSRLYFDYELPELARLICISNKLQDYEKYIFLALLRRAMIRKLPYSRMNVKWEKIAQLRDEDYSYRMYGRRRAYHNESFTKHMIDGLEDYNQSIFDNGKVCYAVNEDVLSIAHKIDFVDAVYLDPPYPGTTNDYESFYGPFGEMFGYSQNIKTDFTSKDTFCDHLKELLDALRHKTNYYVMSINTVVKPAPETIIELLKQYGSVSVLEKNHNYQLTGKENKTSNKELLLIVTLDHSIHS